MRISDWSSDVCSSDLAKRRALEAAAAAIRARAGEIAGANAKDMAAARGKGLTDALLDRLALTPDRIEVMARGVEEVAALPAPVGRPPLGRAAFGKECGSTCRSVWSPFP